MEELGSDGDTPERDTGESEPEQDEEDIPERPQTSTGNYQRLFFLGKEIARIGCRDLAFPRAEGQLTELLESMLLEFGEPTVSAEVSLGKRKGRHRTKGHGTPTRVRPRIKCPLCGHNHLLEECPQSQLLQEQIDKMPKTHGRRGRPCAICHSAGHGQKQCPALVAARGLLAEAGETAEQ
jgi:hypothetical protein